MANKLDGPIGWNLGPKDFKGHEDVKRMSEEWYGHHEGEFQPMIAGIHQALKAGDGDSIIFYSMVLGNLYGELQRAIAGVMVEIRKTGHEAN